MERAAESAGDVRTDRDRSSYCCSSMNCVLCSHHVTGGSICCLNVVPINKNKEGSDWGCKLLLDGFVRTFITI